MNLHSGQFLGGHAAEGFYDVTGQDASGKELVRTAYGKQLHYGRVVMVSRIQKILEPDQSYSESMDVSKVFDLSRQGFYRFQVKRRYLLNEKVDLDSNTVTVEIK